MKLKLIILALLTFLSLNVNAQQKSKKTHSSDKAGYGLVTAGAISMSIGFLIPDGSEWTFSKGYNSQVITKPFYKNPARVACIGVGLTLTIGGFAYNKNH